MKLYEFEGKELFRKYGITVPEGILLHTENDNLEVKPPLVLKAQVKSGDRKKHGGIVPIRSGSPRRALQELFLAEIQGEDVKSVLAEKFVKASAEYYVSLSYDSVSAGPVLALSLKGGSGVARVHIHQVDMLQGLPPFSIRTALRGAGFPSGDINGLTDVIQKLWKLFTSEYALLAEINPLFKTPTEAGGHAFIAGDAKIILDDERINSNERRFVSMGGDIAILASGGGASMINVDALLAAGGRPANYTEYSGNPPASVVKDLTKRVLTREGISGCWVVGGIANFTDIYETLHGFVEGLREIKPKPDYPIVIRRDGPRQKEAFEMLREVKEKEGYDLHLYGGETSMEETARVIVKLAKKYKSSHAR